MAPLVAPDGRRVWIGGVPLNVVSQDLIDEFEQYGDIETTEVGFGTRMAFLLFTDKEGAAKATERDWCQFKGNRVNVRNANEKGFNDALRKREMNQTGQGQNNGRELRGDREVRRGGRELRPGPDANREGRRNSESRRRSGSEQSGSAGQRKPLPRRHLGPPPRNRPPLRNPRPQQRQADSPRGRNRGRSRPRSLQPRSRSPRPRSKSHPGADRGSPGGASRGRSPGRSRSNRSGSRKSRRSRSSSSASRKSSSVSSRELVGGGTDAPTKTELQKEQSVGKVDRDHAVEKGNADSARADKLAAKVEESLAAGSAATVDNQANGGADTRADDRKERSRSSARSADSRRSVRTHGSARSASDAPAPAKDRQAVGGAVVRSQRGARSRSARSASAPRQPSQNKPASPPPIAAAPKSKPREKPVRPALVAPTKAVREKTAAVKKDNYRMASPIRMASPVQVVPETVPAALGATAQLAQLARLAAAPEVPVLAAPVGFAGARPVNARKRPAEESFEAAQPPLPPVRGSAAQAIQAPAPAVAPSAVALPETIPVVLTVLTEGDLIGIGLTFKDRRKMVKHQRNTLIGDLAGLHPQIPKGLNGQPIVVKDQHGFEVGRELTLDILEREQAAGPDCGRPVELFLSYDEW